MTSNRTYLVKRAHGQLVLYNVILCANLEVPLLHHGQHTVLCLVSAVEYMRSEGIAM